MRTLKIFSVLFLLSFFSKAQTDSCAAKTCKGFQNTDLYQIYGKLQQIKNQTAGGGGSTATVTVTNPFLKETTYRDSVHNSNTDLLLINAGIQSGLSLFARQTTLNQMYNLFKSQAGNSFAFDTISGSNLSIANTSYNSNVDLDNISSNLLTDASVKSVFRENSSGVSVFKKTNGKGVFFTDAYRSVFIDSVSNKPFSYILGLINTTKARQDSLTAEMNKLYSSQFYTGKTTANWLQGIATALITGPVPVSGTVTTIPGTNDVRQDSLTAGVTRINNAVKTYTTVSVNNFPTTVTATPATFTVTDTYTYVSAAATTTITAGAKLISIGNVGTFTATVDGLIIQPSTTVTFPYIPGVTWSQHTYNCNSSLLQIITVR